MWSSLHSHEWKSVMIDIIEYEEVNVGKHLISSIIRAVCFSDKLTYHHLQVRLGMVDIFQGQEAGIVIISLVHNSGQINSSSGSIGFLKVCPTACIKFVGSASCPPLEL